MSDAFLSDSRRRPFGALAGGRLLLAALLLVGFSARAQAPASEQPEASAPATEASSAPATQESAAPSASGAPSVADSPEDSTPTDAKDEAIVLSTAAGSVEVGGRLDVRENLERPEGGIWAGELSIPSARVEVTYRWKKRLRAVVEFDVRAEIKDAYAWLKIANGFAARAGRFKMPLSLVESESTTRLPLVRRGLLRDVLDDSLSLSGRRPGAQLEWKCPSCERELKLQAAVFQTKDLDGKVALERGIGLMPALRGTWDVGPVVVGASALLQPKGASAGGDQGSWLAELDVRHTLNLGSGALRTWAELITGKAALIGGTGNALMGRAVTAWRIGGAKAGKGYLEPVLMVSAIDPDRDRAEDLLWEGSLGLNAGMWERWRVQAQFEVRKVGAGVSPALLSLDDGLASRRALLVQLEVGF
ncbi:porin [Hyalangium versicolor]|uniref:porin n=1 Tax=Hyalangium versicolor TaxID=2861190 RepID=UPI001CCFC1DE|nr:porin [Hyalangium versicolor]